MNVQLLFLCLFAIVNFSTTCCADPDFGLYACTSRQFMVNNGVVTLDIPTTFGLNTTQIMTSVPFTSGSATCIFGLTEEGQEVAVVIEFVETGFNYPYKQIMTCLDDPIGSIPEKECQCPGGSGSVLGDISECPNEQTCFRGTEFGNATGCLFMNGNAKHHFKVQYDTSKVIDVVNFENELSFPSARINIHVYNDTSAEFQTYSTVTEIEDADFSVSNFYEFTGTYTFEPYKGVGVTTDEILIESIPLHSAFHANGRYYHVPESKMNDMDTFDMNKMCSVRKVGNSWQTNVPDLHSRIRSAVSSKRCKPNSDLILEETLVTSKQYSNENYDLDNLCSYQEWNSDEVFCGYNSAEEISFTIALPPGVYYDIVSKPVFSITSSDLTYYKEDDAMSSKICVHNAGSKGIAKVNVIDSFGMTHELGSIVVEKSATSCGIYTTGPMSGNVKVCVLDYQDQSCVDSTVILKNPVIDTSFSQEIEFNSNDKTNGTKESWAYVGGDKTKWTWRLIVLVVGLILAGLLICLFVLIGIANSSCCKKKLEMWEMSKKVKEIEHTQKLKEYEQKIEENQDLLEEGPEIIDMDEVDEPKKVSKGKKGQKKPKKRGI